ncbi:Sen15 protein-domain-containing protein [Calycina marina]|uniref:Sen15 protein-domain-containing protein n=1 Tax=Calycina marina TaxID=1763456 RepID=A0A9P7ZA93_9HELO|nr:Sen15 protein-domain-containing protein [Calycina marina]
MKFDTHSLPPASAIQDVLDATKSTLKDSPHEPHFLHLAEIVKHNLQFQHDWTSVRIHTHSSSQLSLPRPIVSGLPPRRAYIHPEEQVEILKAEHETGKPVEQVPEQEWVLPTHWDEKWTLNRFAEMFDAIEVVPGAETSQEEDDEEEDISIGYKWRGKNRQKRVLLSTVHDDSTVVYYIMHDGLAKPRQN